MDIDFRDYILMAVAFMALVLYVNSKYEHNYYFQGFLILFGMWFYTEMIAVFETDGNSVLFPLILLIFSLLVNIFNIQDTISIKRKMEHNHR